jgi:hypothetical protein
MCASLPKITQPNLSQPSVPTSELISFCTNFLNKQCLLGNIGLNGKLLHFRRDGVSKPRSFYKAGIEKLVTHWETVIVSNGNYIID